MKSKKRKRIRVGNVYAIPLPDGSYGFARMHLDSTLGFYKQRKDKIEDFDENDEYEFFVGVYYDLLTDGLWPFLKNVPFQSIEDSYPPDMCVVDALTGELSLYRMGEIMEAPYEVCKDLEVVAAWDRNHIEDRLMGDDRWHRDMKKV